MRPHEKLMVWQESMELVNSVYSLTRAIPKEELSGLTSQMRRAAVSIPSNIAEGAARGTEAELRRFLYIARGSLSELETLIQVARHQGMLDENAGLDLLQRSERVGKLLGGMINKVRSGGISEDTFAYES